MKALTMPSTRWFNRAVLVAAVAIGAASAWGSHRWLQARVDEIEARASARETIDVVVAKDDLAPGTRLGPDNVAVRRIPAEARHSGALTPEAFGREMPPMLAHPARRGEPIVDAQLDPTSSRFSARIAPGQRAVTVPVDEINSISGLLAPGDRIDLVASVRAGPRAWLVPVLDDVRVLATGTRASVLEDGSASRRPFTTVTLDVSADQATRVLAARETGRLSAWLRAPGDRRPAPDARVDALALLGVSTEAAAGVPVIYGGSKLGPIAALAGASVSAGNPLSEPSAPNAFPPVPAYERARADVEVAR